MTQTATKTIGPKAASTATIEAGDSYPRSAVVPVEPTSGGALAPPSIIDRLPPFLKAGALLARDTCGCGDAHAALLAIAAQGIALGPAHRVIGPDGAGLHAATLDLLLVDGPAGHLMAACRRLLVPLTDRVAKILGQRRGMTANQLRAALLVADQKVRACVAESAQVAEIVRALDQYRLTGRQGPELKTEMIQNEVRYRRQAQQMPTTEALAILDRGTALFAAKPVIRTGGLTADTIRRWEQIAFDGHAADVLESGWAIVASLSEGPQVLRFLECAEAGESGFAIGARQYADAGVCLLWACHRDELAGLLGHPALADRALASRLLAVPCDGTPPRDSDKETRAPWARAWDEQIEYALQWRLRTRRGLHRLCTGAVGLHRQFATECEAMAEREADPRAAAHLAALPRTALRVALGLKVGVEVDGLPDGDITAEQHALAIDLVHVASDAHLNALALCPFTAPATGLEAEIEVLVAKLRIRGTLTRRELVRSYHRGGYRRLEPVLEAAVRQGLVTLDGDKLAAAQADGCRRVGASAEAG